MRTIIPVTSEEAGMRLDRFLKLKLPQLTHSWMAKACRKGQILVAEVRAEVSTRVAAGQEVELKQTIPEAEASDQAIKRPVPRHIIESLHAATIYQDEEILVINKPAGLSVQGGTKVTWSVDDCLIPLATLNNEEPNYRLVHRLDKETSGLLVIAKTRPAAVAYTGFFRGQEIRKTYLAVILGVPRKQTGTIELPLYKTGKSGTQRVIVTADGEPAITHYRVLASVGQEAALLELSPETGRTHQLRVHLSALEDGHPILGDSLYNAHKHPATAALQPTLGNLLKKLHLHAQHLQLPHKPPLSAPLPAHLQETIALLGLTNN